MNAAIDEAAAAAERRPEEIRRLLNVNGSFGTGAGFLEGPPRQWAEQLAELTLETGMSAYILAADAADDLRRFAEEVVPAVRELVADARGATDRPAPSPPPRLDEAATARRARHPRPRAPAQRRARMGRGHAADRAGARPRHGRTARASRPPASTSSTSTTRCAASSPSCATSSSRSRPGRATPRPCGRSSTA